MPEIYDGIIEIKAAARDPGSRAKIGVISYDSSIDPVGACVGMKGSRVQAVVQELQGEKIDIIPWSEDTATFVVNALQPATVSRVVIDEEESRIEVVVPDDQLSLAIGRRGQNVRLASQLTNSQIDILTEADACEKRQREFVERSEMFQTELDVDETLAQLLVAEGFTSLEEVAYVEVDEIASIEGLDDDIASELQSRADRSARAPRSRVRARNAARWASRMRWPSCRTSPSDAGDARQGQDPTLDDLADLATDELIQKKRPEPRRRAEAEQAPRGQGRRARRLWPDRRAGQRDHHGRPRALVRGRGRRADSRQGGGRRCGILAMSPATPNRPDAHVPERTCVLPAANGAARGADPACAWRPTARSRPTSAPARPGRGAWIGVGRAELDAANAKGKLKGALARAFKTSDVTIPADLGERIEAALRQAALDRLGLEARGGTLINGADTRRECGARRQGPPADPRRRCRRGRPPAARPGLAGRRRRSAQRGWFFPRRAPSCRWRLGRENVVHIALTDRAAAPRVCARPRPVASFH